jgi:SagB-type dehydrogenase family enzyme
MDQTRPIFLHYHRNSLLAAGESNVQLEDWPDEWLLIDFKGYPRFERIPLPATRLADSKPLDSLIHERRSERMFARDMEVGLDKLSRVLSTLRITSGFSNTTYDSRRAYSSAGGRYPIEAYILPLRVTGLKPCVHHYNVRSDSLEQLWSFTAANYNSCFPREVWCADAAAAVILTACHGRASIKYGERAYRYCLIEAGQIAQNIQLLCTDEGLGCCNFGGFHDESVMRLLDIDPNQEIVLHTLFFGHTFRAGL